VVILFEVLTKAFVKDGTLHSCDFPQISRTVLYEISTVKLDYHDKFRSGWVPKMLTGAHKTQRTTSTSIFSERYHKDGHDFLNHIIKVTWTLFMYVEDKAVKVGDAHNSPNEPKMFRQTSARKLMAAVFWERKGMLMGHLCNKGPQ
jgi:hypothetical protein